MGEERELSSMENTQQIDTTNIYPAVVVLLLRAGLVTWILICTTRIDKANGQWETGRLAADSHVV